MDELATIVRPKEPGLARGPFLSIAAALLYADAHGGREAFTFETIASPDYREKPALRLVAS
jgi:hypothetical protein